MRMHKRKGPVGDDRVFLHYRLDETGRCSLAYV